MENEIKVLLRLKIHYEHLIQGGYNGCIAKEEANAIKKIKRISAIIDSYTDNLIAKMESELKINT